MEDGFSEYQIHVQVRKAMTANPLQYVLLSTKCGHCEFHDS